MSISETAQKRLDFDIIVFMVMVLFVYPSLQVPAGFEKSAGGQNYLAEITDIQREVPVSMTFVTLRSFTAIAHNAYG